MKWNPSTGFSYLLSTIATGSGRRAAASFHFADFRLPILACETNIQLQKVGGCETIRAVERTFKRSELFHLSLVLSKIRNLEFQLDQI